MTTTAHYGAPAGSDRAKPTLRVLVVEDEPVSRTVLARMLGAMAYETATATDGLEALELLDTQHVDIVLTDLAMPGMDGFELTAAIRARKLDRWLPIVGITGTDDQGSEARLIELGADGLLHKPIHREMLRSVLRNLTRTLSLQHRIRTQNRDFRTAADSIIDAVICIDERGRIAIANRATELLFGYRREDLIGQNVKVLMPDPIRDEHDGYLARYRETRTASIIGSTRRVLAQHKSGSLFPVELSVTENALEESDFRYIGVIRSLEESERLERLRRDFISVVNHELRTPLTSIHGALRLLGTSVAGKLTPKGQHMVDVALRNAERLRRLIDDILDLEKIESGQWRVRLTPARLDLAVAEAIETNHHYAAAAKVRLHLEHSTEVSAAIVADRFQQVMSNLLSNAIKYSASGAQVEVRLDAMPAGARISITNHGAPIPVELRQRLFERFAQAENVDRRQHQGTGLGLAITRGIVEGFGGSIGYTSDERDTCFFVTLPSLDGTAEHHNGDPAA